MSGVATVYNDPREIAPGVWWIPLCLERIKSGIEVHLHNSLYLIAGSEKTLLFDGGMPHAWEGIQKSLKVVLGDRPLDYIVPSHPELAHCGCVPQLMAKYPNAELLGDRRDYPRFFPKFADRMFERAIGSEIDLGSHKFVFVDAIIKDLPSTQWGYERTQQVLFVGDGFAYSHQQPLDGEDEATHAPGECVLCASEVGRPPSKESVVWITKSALYWTRFVEMDRFLLEPFKLLLEEHPTRLVAPAHGAVIDDLELLWTVWDALRQSYDPALGVAQAVAGLTGAHAD
jgi:hypothetical protein